MRILGIYVGDANGDGKNELIVVYEGKVEIYARKGEKFELLEALDVPILYITSRGVFIEDVNADGEPEIIAGYIDFEKKIHLEMYRGGELVSSIISNVPGGNIVGVRAADVNSDKAEEIIAIGENSQGYTTMTVRLPTEPKLMRVERVPIGKKVLDFVVGDFDGDGSVEVFILTEEGISYRKNGMRRFEKFGIEAYDIHTIELADVNGDLFIELVLASRSGIYVYSGRELIKEFNVGADIIDVHDVDNDGVEEVIAYQAGKLCIVDVETGKVDCRSSKAAKYLVAGKFGDKRLVIAADENEFRIAAEFKFAVPNVFDEFNRISAKYKPLLARYILELAFGSKEKGLEGELLNEARLELHKGSLNKAYRIVYQLLEGSLPNPKKAARIAVLFAAYLMRNPGSKLREMLEKIAVKKEKKKAKRPLNPRESLERLKRGEATEDDLIAAVSLYLHDPHRLKGRVNEFFELVRKQFGSSAALDSLLTIFHVASKIIRAEILLTILANYLNGNLFPNEIRSAFRRAAEKFPEEKDLFNLFADIVLKYGQRGLAALIAALSYTKANPDALKLIPEPTFNFRPSRPMRLEEIPIPDARLVPLIIHGKVRVVKRGDDVSNMVFRIQR